MDERTRQVRMQQWMKTIQAWSASGQSKNQWCADNGVSLRQFYYWQRIIRQELCDASGPVTDLIAADQSRPCLVDITPRTEIAQPVQAVEAQAIATIRTDRLEIHVPANASGELLNCIRRIVCHAL